MSIAVNDEGQAVHSKELMALLTRVNKEINRIPYKTDKANYGRIDYWTDKIKEQGSGDCDDYMLAKRKALIEQGVPWQSLSPAICLVEGEGHAVLLCRTTKGTFVLDNNTDAIYLWEILKRRGFKWLSWLEPVSGTWFSLE